MGALIPNVSYFNVHVSRVGLNQDHVTLQFYLSISHMCRHSKVTQFHADQS